MGEIEPKVAPQRGEPLYRTYYGVLMRERDEGWLRLYPEPDDRSYYFVFERRGAYYDVLPEEDPRHAGLAEDEDAYRVQLPVGSSLTVVNENLLTVGESGSSSSCKEADQNCRRMGYRCMKLVDGKWVCDPDCCGGIPSPGDPHTDPRGGCGCCCGCKCKCGCGC